MFRRSIVRGLLGLMLIAAGGFLPRPSAAAEEIDFRRDIRPILSNKCVSCHGPDDEHREADLRLDREEDAKADRGGYAAVVPADRGASEMAARITSDDPDLVMPPPDAHKDLTPAERELLLQWIDAGAPWAEHWAYEVPQPSELPAVQQADWPQNGLDFYTLSRIEQAGLTPNPRADRVTLLRRLSFDLTGLPPTTSEVDAFLQDESADAVATVVDRLLASDHFGERMAMHWLDLVRYADTVGYHGDQDHNISPYRDWVIDAFNDNKPFDRMTLEQLAGDLLPDANIDTQIASGYNRLLQTTHEGGLQPKEYLAIYAADRIRNLSSVWMGATVGCAQCHTHKYDPYTIEDFYSLAAFFADIDEAEHFKKGGNSLPTNRPPEIYVLSKRDRVRFGELSDTLKTLQAELAEVLDGEIPYRPELDAELTAVSGQLQELQQRRRKTMITAAIAPRTMRVLPRGNWLDDSGPIVEPAIPEFLGRLDTADRRANRLDLARWLVDAEQGAGLLTARVYVNRLWALMFGTGLADLHDFGGQGRPPTHPELLDHLALEFVESGWDVKALLRQIALSATYQQSSIPTAEAVQIDPQNRWLGRQNRFRLPAEMIRDNVLAVSGLLVRDYGGPSAKPYQPAGYYRHLNFPKRTYAASTDDSQWRRGVYVHWQRQFLHPMLKAFDAPSREECTAERPRSNTPLAALTLLNDPTFLEASRKFAERILQTTPESVQVSSADADRWRLDWAARQALSRPATPGEMEVLTATLNKQRQFYKSQPELTSQYLQNGISPVAEKLDPVEVAAWGQIARVLLNLNETLTRN